MPRSIEIVMRGALELNNNRVDSHDRRKPLEREECNGIAHCRQRA
jgi:hypothetical protein